MSTHRYVCDVLGEMRTAVKVGRIDMLSGLIEEIQTMANRMEAQLYEYRDVGYDLEAARDLRKELKSLKKTAEELEKDLETGS